jgi:hypothetical protein
VEPYKISKIGCRQVSVVQFDSEMIDVRIIAAIRNSEGSNSRLKISLMISLLLKGWRIVSGLFCSDCRCIEDISTFEDQSSVKDSRNIPTINPSLSHKKLRLSNLDYP